MLLTLDPDRPIPLYLQLVEEVERAVALGAIRANDPLPSARQLAADLHINPNTVKQALRELERRGVVTIRRGLGAFVAEGSARRTSVDLRRQVARRALEEAKRYGMTLDDLVAALEAERPGRRKAQSA